jgi:hypothetical protein
MALLARKRILVLALEGSNGVDEGPVGADAMLTKGLEVVPINGTFVQRDLDREVLGSQGQILTKRSAGFNFGIELAGSGTIGDPPKWGRALRICGFGETIDSATKVTYAPVSSSFASATMKAYLDGQRHVGLMCRATGQMTFEAGQIPMLAFQALGLYQTPASASDPTPVVSQFQVPKPVTFANTGTFTMHGVAAAVVSLSIDFGVQVEHIDLPGYQSIEIVDRQMTGQMTIHAPAISVKDWFTAVDQRTEGALSLIHGPAANMIEVSAPKVEVSNPRYGESQGIRTLQMDLILKPNAGNDEIAIISR